MPKDLIEFKNYFSEIQPSDSVMLAMKFTPGMDAKPVSVQELDESFEPEANFQYYFTPNFIDPAILNKGKLSQGKKEDVKYVSGITVDMDFGKTGHKKPSNFKNEIEVMEKLNDAPLRPTIIVFSGHGIQPYFMFDKALEIGKDITIKEYEALAKQVQNALNADTTGDINHIYRLPGSMNLKTDKPVPVAIRSMEKQRYTLADFDVFVSDDDSTDSQTEETTSDHLLENIPVMKIDMRKVPDRAKKIINEMYDMKNPDNKDRSSLIQTLVGILFAKDMSSEEIFSAVMKDGSASAEYMKEIKASDKERTEYIQRSIDKYEEQEKKQNLHVFNSLNAEILGYDEELKIVFRKKGIIHRISINQLGTDNIQFMTGVRVNKKKLDGYKRTIIDIASKKGIIDESNDIKEGVWKFGKHFLIVSKDGAVIYDEKDGARPYTKPVYKNRIVDATQASSWIDLNHFNDVIDDITLSGVYTTLQTYTAMFNWKHKEAADYSAALLMLLPLEQAMTWRPWTYITGASGTGKSTFLQALLCEIYPGLVRMLGKSTAHAIAQEVGNSGRIPVLDEFEKDPRLFEILELAKTSGGGGTKTSGTPGKHSLRFNMHHNFIFSSIYLSLYDEAQKNRVLILELERHLNTQPPQLPSNDDLKRLGTEIVAAMVKYWPEIEKRSQKIKNRYPDLDFRMKDTLKYLIAVLEISMEEISEQEVILNPPVFAYTTPEKEEEQILDDIMHSDIWINAGPTDSSESKPVFSGKKTVFQALQNYEISKQDLNNAGVAQVVSNGKAYLALHTPTVQRKLLKDLKSYETLKIQEPLSRFDGSIKNKNANLGNTAKCLWIPWDVLNERYL